MLPKFGAAPHDIVLFPTSASPQRLGPPPRRHLSPAALLCHDASLLASGLHSPPPRDLPPPSRLRAEPPLPAEPPHVAPLFSMALPPY
jgi:hypothetical protein